MNLRGEGMPSQNSIQHPSLDGEGGGGVLTHRERWLAHPLPTSPVEGEVLCWCT